MHAGLGAGTQLAAAAAWGISLCAGLTARPSVDELVQWSGRGKRSGIGIYGFLHGGLVLDEGHALPVPQGPMQGPCQGGSSSVSQGPRQLNAASSPLYTAWRVVLVTPDRSTEVTGGYEVSLIERLGQASNPNRDRMHARARRVLELAGSAGGFFEFTGALQEYVDAAGELFAAEQGGMYNGDPVQQAVYLAKQSGLRAVGQSSWGPTVFGFAESEIQAERIASQLLDGRPNERWQIRICTPARQGASWRWIQE
jgi:beta-ribofuranosylaminobenzene 5'-phosphate synthase